MARSRSIPTDLFEQPAFFELDSETQVILIGLVLGADDHGRGVAHSRLLARKLDKEERLIERALTTLEAREWLCCYQGGRTRYYALLCWQEWQSLHKPTPSKYPAPPAPSGAPHPSGDAREDSGKPRVAPEHPGSAGDIRSEEEEEDEEEKEERTRNEEEEEASPEKVVTILSPHARAGGCDDASLTQGTISQKTHQVAQILHLPISEALMRVVADYHADGSLSLLGEADAAHEWMEDRQRNCKGQTMTPTFFRRWLGREQASIQVRQHTHHPKGASRIPTPSSARTAFRGSAQSIPPEDPYAAFVERRVQEVKATAAARCAAAEQEAIVV